MWLHSIRQGSRHHSSYRNYHYYSCWCSDRFVAVSEIFSFFKFENQVASVRLTKVCKNLWRTSLELNHRQLDWSWTGLVDCFSWLGYGEWMFLCKSTYPKCSYFHHFSIRSYFHFDLDYVVQALRLTFQVEQPISKLLVLAYRVAILAICQIFSAFRDLNVSVPDFFVFSKVVRLDFGGMT